jgi:hypothetical protein
MLNLLKKGSKWEWTEEHEKSFNDTKELFINSVVISHPDFTKRMFLQTDSSDHGLGAVLSQRNETGEERVISLISRTLRSPEFLYSTTEKEMLAIVWALQKLREFLLGREFTIITDHKSLTFLNRCHLRNSRMIRWALWIEEFSFEIEHREGKGNIVPDWLSRHPCGDGELPGRNDADYMVATIELGIAETPWRGVNELQRAQLEDPRIAPVARFLRGDLTRDHPEFRNIVRRADRFRCHQGIVCVRVGRAAEFRVWVPSSHVEKLVRHIHTGYAHFGAQKVAMIAREKFFWKNMGKQIRSIIRSCDVCQRTKHPNRNYSGQMQNIIPSQPREVCALDLFGPLPKARGGNKFILVAVDVFSKFVQVYPLNKPTSKNCLYHFEKYIAKCGKPQRVLTDHGTQFTSDTWREKLREWDIRVGYSSIRHPQSNPSERIMRELSRLFRVYCAQRHTSWPELLPDINKWLNEIPHDSTGMSPYEAHFGVKPKPRFKIDGGEEGENVLPRDNIQLIVLDNLRRSGGKRRRAQKKSGYTFDQGDEVLLRFPRASDTISGLFHKFFPLFKGPYTIRKIVAKNACELVDEQGEMVGVYNFFNLIPYFREM